MACRLANPRRPARSASCARRPASIADDWQRAGPAAHRRTRSRTSTRSCSARGPWPHGAPEPDGTEELEVRWVPFAGGPRDDPRRPDHGRADRLRHRATGAPSVARFVTLGATVPWTGTRRARRSPATSIRRWSPNGATGMPSSSGSVAIGSGAAYWLSRTLGSRRPGPGAVRAGSRPRRLGRPQSDHPALLSPAGLRAPRRARLRVVGRRRGGGRATGSSRSPAAWTCGRRRRRDPEGRTTPTSLDRRRASRTNSSTPPRSATAGRSGRSATT